VLANGLMSLCEGFETLPSGCVPDTDQTIKRTGHDESSVSVEMDSGDIV